MADPLHQFEIIPLVPLNIAGVDVSFTNSSLWMMIAILISIVFMTIVTKRPAMVPGRMQVFADLKNRPHPKRPSSVLITALP